MGPSFGLPRFITDRPLYNFGLALPLICAFYLFNSPDPIELPYIHFVLSHDLSFFIKIAGVSAVYGGLIFCALFVSVLSLGHLEHPWRRAGSVFVTIFGVFAFSSHYWDDSGSPTFPIVFGLILIIYGLWSLREEASKYSSFLVVALVFGFLSVVCFSTGVLWLNGNFIFLEEVKGSIGVVSAVPKSLPIGGAMLIATGYSLFYTVYYAAKMLGLSEEVGK